MQFSVMQTEVADQAGLDLTDTTTKTRVQRWLNIVQQDIVSRWPWEFARGREVIQTVIDKSAGTVAIPNGGTTVTGTGTAFAAGDVGKFIQINGANDWYKVTAFTSSTSITIEAPYTQTTATAAGYLLRQMFYSLSSSADSILDIRNWNTPLKIYQTDPRLLDTIVPNPQSTNSPSAFITYGYDSSGNIQISPYPFPNDVRNFEIRTWKRATDMSADTDTSIIPSKWSHIITYGANSLAFAYKRDASMAGYWKNLYEEKIGDMVLKCRTSEDEMLVLQPIDSRERPYFLSMGGTWPVVR